MSNKTCQICGKEVKRIASHLRYSHLELSSKQYFDKYLKEDGEGICALCGKDTTFSDINKRYHKYCSTKCSANSKEKQMKVKIAKKEKYGDPNYNNMKKNKETKLERHGDENYNNREKHIETCQERYRVNHYTETKKILEQKKVSCQERYDGVGFASKELRSKGQETCREKYGDPNYHNKEKYKKTCLKRYGVEHPNQCEAIFQKRKIRWKDYTLPSRNVVKIQGYEDRFLDEYFANGGKEEDIIFQRKEMPKIWYLGEDGKKHRYFPDFFIPKDNLIIEVKSTWTIGTKPEKNLLKEKACKDLGYKFQFAIYGKRKYINIEKRG